MYVNIWGHVKNPGTYLVYEGIDLMTLISLAGGPLTGANLSKIRLIRLDEEMIIDLNSHLNNNRSDTPAPTINPHDTIYIKESLTSYLVSKANLFPILLQIVNLGVTIQLNKD